MNILSHDEAADTELLNRLPERVRTLFAFLCALRIRPAYLRFWRKTGRGDPATLRSLSERLWRDLLGEQMTRDEAQAAVDRAMELVPSEEDGWDDETQPYAEDAAAALAYAFRARLTGDAREAVWAGRRVYEAADHFARAVVARTSLITLNDEMAIRSHPLVQAELARQQRDLRELAELDKAGCLDLRLPEMRERSNRESDALFQVD